jgi:hypothetical protein
MTTTLRFDCGTMYLSGFGTALACKMVGEDSGQCDMGDKSARKCGPVI